MSWTYDDEDHLARPISLPRILLAARPRLEHGNEDDEDDTGDCISVVDPAFKEGSDAVDGHDDDERLLLDCWKAKTCTEPVESKM